MNNIDYNFYIEINNLKNIKNLTDCVRHYTKNKNNKNIIKNIKDFLELFDFNFEIYKKIIYQENNITFNNNKELILHFTKNILKFNYNINSTPKFNINKNKKILVICENYPGYGGAATNTYNLIKNLRNKGYFVVGIFLNNNSDYQIANVDPDKIGYIFNVQFMIFNNTEILNKLKKVILDFFKGKPDLIINRMIISPILGYFLFKEINSIYYVTGMSQSFPMLNFSKFKLENIEHKINRVFDNDIKNLNFYELKSIKYSTKIIFNSKNIKKIFTSFYRYTNYKIHDKIVNSIFFNLKNEISIEDKEYDIILCCSNFLRPEKNNLFILDILKNNFHNYKKIIIGNESHIFSNIKNSKCINLITNDEVLKYFKKSKILLFPSLNDSNPSTIVEAFENKCIPIISNFVGTRELFPDFLLCNALEKKEWIIKISNILNDYENIFNNMNFKLNFKDDNIHILDYIDSLFN